MIESRPDADQEPYSRPELLQMFVALRRLTVAVEHFHVRAADRLGLAMSEVVILSLVDHPSAKTPTELAAVLGRNASTITAAIDRLEAAGMVARRPHPKDRRKTMLSLSKQGRAAMEWLRAMGEDSFGGLADDVLATMAGSLDTAAAAIEANAERIDAGRL